jgi:succinate-semialdehyde dehydrogenase/glutarate-semialdehyde dehydrogenase
LADILEKDKEYHAALETKEMGRLFETAKKWLNGTIHLIRWFADHAESILATEPIDNEGLRGHIQYDSLGVIYGIAPWNFPYNQLLRAAVPNILAGNTQIYKHASNVPQCAIAIEQLFKDAWFPKWVYTKLFISSSKSDYIIAHKHVRGVNLTGGERAGATIGSLAGKYLKPSVLELGGNDPFVLLDHTDTKAVVADAVACRISNGWQRCNASKRFIILEQHYDNFVSLYAECMDRLTVGDPMESETELPPMSSRAMIEEIHGQVQATINQWARLVTGGRILDENHNLYAPTVLADVTPQMTSYREEVFWPVASIIKSSSIEESIAIANHNDLGLSAVVYGDNIQQCNTVAKQLQGGMIFINQPAGSKASLPFGWVKKSGYGKENGPDGLKAFTNKKAILY